MMSAVVGDATCCQVAPSSVRSTGPDRRRSQGLDQMRWCSQLHSHVGRPPSEHSIAGDGCRLEEYRWRSARSDRHRWCGRYRRRRQPYRRWRRRLPSRCLCWCTRCHNSGPSARGAGSGWRRCLRCRMCSAWRWRSRCRGLGKRSHRSQTRVGRWRRRR